MRMPTMLLVAFCVSILGCDPGACFAGRWGYKVTNDVVYQVAAAQVTPGGIRFDPTGQPISGALIDRLTKEVGDCLKVTVDTSSFVVKVPMGWEKSCDGQQELLPSGAPESGCSAKGLPPDPKCPCRWRALIQCPNTIVATPSLYLFKDALVRFVVGTNNPWADAHLAECASPSTPPLSTLGSVALY